MFLATPSILFDALMVLGGSFPSLSNLVTPKDPRGDGAITSALADLNFKVSEIAHLVPWLKTECFGTL